MKNSDEAVFIKASIITVVLSSLGFALLELNLVPYGCTLFCVMPVLIGYVIGQFPKFSITIVFASILGMVMFFYLLIIGGLESLFCVITLSPFLYLLLFVGMYIGFLIKKAVIKKDDNNNTRLSVYILPIIILFISSAIEKFFTEKYTEVTIETKIMLPYSREMVFDYVKSFDTLQSEKPFLFSIGIQTPLKCVLEKDSVGAKRTCYFKEGTIDEIVTDYKRGEILQMKITKYNMPGRKWLHFQDAIYLFKAVGDSTELTRITTYKSELKPRFYWGFWEEKAVRAEHDYVMADLRRRLINAAGHKP
jgi:hypothetical protein